MRTRACRKTSSSGDLKPAREVCIQTCETCDDGGSPTPAPTSGQSPTNAPTPVPTNSGDCNDQTSFYWSTKRGTVLLKECSWLSGQNDTKKRKLCAGRVQYGAKDGVVYGPPEKACALTCDACDPCYQNNKSTFFWKEKNNKSIIKNCAWLKKKNTASQDNICTSGKTDGVYPSADVACPQVCSIGSC